MPLVRISHPAGHPPGYGAALSDGVHRAMVATFGVPDDDRFQIVTEHVPGPGIVRPPSFRGVEFSDALVFIQITCAEGRTLDQKRALFAAIADNLAAAPGLRRDDVIVNLVETRRENWSFGNGLATFA